MECLHGLINAVNRLPVVVLTAVLCVSCSKDTPDSPGEGYGMQPLNVDFRIAVPVDASATDGAEYDGNGTWGDGYDKEDALPAENRIDLNTFSVTFFSAENQTYIWHLDDIHCVTTLPEPGQNIYVCNGKLKPEAGETVDELVQKLRSSGTVRMLVTANVTGITPETLKKGMLNIDAGLGGVEYSCNGTLDKQNFPAIPMWGVTTNDFSGLTPGMSMSLGELALLRSVAKVEVRISDELKKASGDKVKLESVSINRMNTKGYVLPGKWNEIGKTKDLKFSETSRIPENAEETENCEFSAGEDGSVVFYLPECQNGTGNREIVMTVRYTVEDEQREGTIRLCNYRDGVPDNEKWDVVRNHLYRYVITNTGEIKFRVEVHPWDEIEIPEIMM